ncbi:MAG TPA: hypothetical protein VFT96_12010 [Gemmatimonadaceae bacterium]|nr:hypothetical protein [Gemmatimonadaceae bacterium]
MRNSGVYWTAALHHCRARPRRWAAATRLAAAVALAALASACSDGAQPTAPETQPFPVALEEGVTGATVTTDKPDYMPGETVTITGAGFAAGELVDLTLVEDAQLHEPRTWTVTADANGGFVDASFSPEEHDLNVIFTLTATGQTSGLVATTTFTDGSFALGSNLPAGTNINVPWRRFGSGFAPANTTCSGTPSLTGTALNVRSTASVLANSANTLQSIEFTAPAVAGYVFVGYARSTDTTTIISSTAVSCFPGTASSQNPKFILKYIPGPTQLAFITGPFTGRVGQCLGPMTVQSQTSANTALAVTATTTVGLSSDNGGTGAGAFYSDASCTTGITSVQIASGSTNSGNFYYRATGRGDGTHELTADDQSPNLLTSATQTQTINKALTTLTYTGDRIVLIGNTLRMRATLSSDFAGCVSGKTIIWALRPDPRDEPPQDYVFWFPGNTTTNSSGVATKDLATTAWYEGIYDGRASFSGDANCEASKDDPAITVLAPGNAATGGGFLAGNKVGGGRVNFGFNVRPVEGSDPTTYRGQFLLLRPEEFRCKGTLDLYGTANGVNYARGTCDFQVWNPLLDGGNGDWEVPSGGEDRQFTIEFIDNGSGKKSPPDQFGFSIDYVGSYNPSFARATLNGGNIDVKSSTGGVTSRKG